MSLLPLTSTATGTNMQTTAFASELLDDIGNLRMSSQIDVSKIADYEECMISTVNAARASSAIALLLCADFCATVTAAALRKVGALRTPPGANLLLQRKSLRPHQKLVPGYAKFKTQEEFDADVLAMGKEGHPVKHETAWARERGLTPICADLFLFPDMTVRLSSGVLSLRQL
jgi:hypothetical protein